MADEAGESDSVSDEAETGTPDPDEETGVSDMPDLPEDCEPGTEGCACYQGDLDGNGTSPLEGECYIDLVCDPASAICEPLDPCPETFGIECDPDGRCWTATSEWSAWARYADPDVVDSAVVAGLLTLTSDTLAVDGECYDVLHSDAHVCIAVLDCVPLLVRPLTEIELVPSACADDGPWSAAEGLSQCWGVLDTYAVELDPNR